MFGPVESFVMESPEGNVLQMRQQRGGLVRDEARVEKHLPWLGEYLRKFSRQTGIIATLHCNGSARRALTPRSEVQLLRVVQEALTNVRKHAGARHAAVSLNADDGVVTLTVADDGSGFDPGRLEAALDHGFGLGSMRERVELVGGTLGQAAGFATPGEEEQDIRPDVHAVKARRSQQQTT